MYPNKLSYARMGYPHPLFRVQVSKLRMVADAPEAVIIVKIPIHMIIGSHARMCM